MNVIDSSARAHRRVVLHADDFGMNEAVNNGILEGFRDGVLTSTSLLANAPAAESGLELWRTLASRPATALSSREARACLKDPALPFDLGVHLNLSQGRPLTGARYPDVLLDRHGRFPGVGRLFAALWSTGRRHRSAIADELAEQCAMLLDHGIAPTHLNGHQYVELMPVVREIVPELLSRFGIPCVRIAHEPRLVRNVLLTTRNPMACGIAALKRLFAGRLRREASSRFCAHPGAFFGTSHAGRIDLVTMKRFLASAARTTTIEIGLHPGRTSKPGIAATTSVGWDDPLSLVRPDELKMLVSLELVELLTANRCRLGRLQELSGRATTTMRRRRTAG